MSATPAQLRERVHRCCVLRNKAELAVRDAQRAAGKVDTQWIYSRVARSISFSDFTVLQYGIHDDLHAESP
jgi:hypothetical protein